MGIFLTTKFNTSNDLKNNEFIAIENNKPKSETHVIKKKTKFFYRKSF